MRAEEAMFSISSATPTSKINEGIILLNNNPPFTGVGRYAYSLYEGLVRIGANIDAHVVYGSHFVGSKGSVIVVEPVPEAIAVLE